MRALAAGQQLSAFLLADIDVAQDLLQLLARDLRADHGVGLQRIGLLDGCDTLQRPLHELVVNAFLDESAARAGADFALIEREHDEAFNGLIEEVIVFVQTSAKKMFGDLPPSSSVTGIRFWLAYCMMSRPVVVSPVKAILATRELEASGLPASRPNPLTILRTPGGSRSPTSSAQTRMLAGVCSAGFSTTQFPAAIAGASFQVAIRIGKFHGMIWPTTPSGSWKW